MPIIWHIMKLYSHYGFNEFVICAGYKQCVIKEYFANYYRNHTDVTYDFADGKNEMISHRSTVEPWKVTVADTGLNVMTGGRIKRIQRYVGNETFMMTYGDGVCDVNIQSLLKFHQSHGKIATLTAVKLQQQKGVLDIGGDNAVRSFREKNLSDGTSINAGFMVLEPAVFNYIGGDDCIFERETLEFLAEQGELMSYQHTGFWQCMDTGREKQQLEKLWTSGRAPWKVW